jgi:hypothetical protein
MGDHHHHHHPRRGSRHAAAGDLRPPEPPLDPLEFLSRSWSASASALDAPRPPPPAPSPSAVLGIGPIAEDASSAATAACEVVDDGSAFAAAGSSFSFASAATSQLIMERILAQSEVAPLTSGRLSHSSGPLTGGGSITDSPPVSPEIDDAKVHCLSPFLCNTVLLQSFLLLPHVTCVLLQHFQYFGCNFQCLH